MKYHFCCGLVLAFFFTSCVTLPGSSKPEWIKKPPPPPYFVGTSDVFTSEQEARLNAERDAALRSARYYGGEFLDYSFDDEWVYRTENSKPQADMELTITRYAVYTSAWISRVASIEYYNEPKGNKFKVYVLTLVSQEEIKNSGYNDYSTWKYAQVIFKGDLLNLQGQELLMNALQEGVQQNWLPINPQLQPDNEPDIYSFEISLSCIFPDHRVDTRRLYTVTIGFIHNGIRYPFAQDSFLEFSDTYAIMKAANFIRSERAFYKKLLLRLVS